MAFSSRTLLQQFTAQFSYPVVFCRDVFGSSELSAVFQRFGTARHRVLAIFDAGLLQHWPALPAQLMSCANETSHFELAAEPLVLPGGEAVKNDGHIVSDLHRRFYDLGLDRHSFVMAVGGGALLDAVGYASATAHRGLRLIRLPTTLLSQNDAGIGVKNGVNLYGSKNFLGTFTPAAAVINDLNFLHTLSQRDRASGMAEAVKVSLIRDREFFFWLEQNAGALSRFDEQAIAYLVEHTARLHLAHIAGSGDPFELGSARPLDFGHWAAHKLESLTHNELRHGEAVAIGIALDTRYSVAKGLLGSDHAERVLSLLERLGLPIWHEALERVDHVSRPTFLEGLEEFRQHLGGRLSITLLVDLGAEVQVHEVDTEEVIRQAQWLKQRSSG